MTITEIALLCLAPNITTTNPSLRTNLAHAKTVMQNYTNHTFYYYQQVENPSLTYIFGEWDSLDQHMNHFVPSQDNQDVLESLKDLLTVESLEHIDVSHANLPLPKTEAEKEEARDGEVLLGLSRFFVKEGKRGEFERCVLREYIARGAQGGWRLDKEDGREEWVLVSSLARGVQQERYVNFVGDEGCGGVGEYVDEVEVTRAKLLDI